MYICVCKSITEEMLEKAIKQSNNPTEALKRLGVGDDCGICLYEHTVLKQAAKDQKKPK
ncbi:MAG: (2Fe-2S)-binding protein [Halobacteriovoraceae bacterium]|nr:(2Fe-2S)-binding protein [Halobacteriovoraceae bacterium]